MDAGRFPLLQIGLRLGAGALVAAVVVVLAAFATAYLTVYPLRRSRWWRPSRMRTSGAGPVRIPNGRGHQDRLVRFSGVDGLELAGTYLDRQADATVVLCHGWPGSQDDMQGLAGTLADAGFNVLTFDFRGWGESDVGPVTLGCREARDVIGAVEYARGQPAARPHRIGVFGLSMGAAASLLAAAECPEIEAVVADSSYTCLDRAVRGAFRGLWGVAAPVFFVPTRWLGERLIGTAMSDVSPLRAITRITPRPVLIIHGTRDRLIDVREARALYQASGDPKALWLIEGADHAEARWVAQGEYDRRVAGFFREHLRG